MKRILIIDDEKDILNIIIWTLKSLKVKLSTAKSMREALKQIKKNNFDMVISNVKLSSPYNTFSGLELISIIKEKSPNTEVIIITSSGSPLIAKEVYKRGARYYFEKPFDLKLFSELVEKALFKKRVQQKMKFGNFEDSIKERE